MILVLGMEVFQIQTCFVFGIVLMFGVIQGLEDYSAKRYFEEHETLNDSEYRIFLDNEVQLSSCHALPTKLNDEPKLLALHRDLIGEGSHRRLVTSIKLQLESTVLNFEVIVIERLPFGVFADPFELQHLVLRGVLKDAAVFGDTNLELPSFRSNRSLVEVHVEISPDMHYGDHFQRDVKIELPLHARYQPLGHGFSVVKFGQPDILLRYRIKQDLANGSCLLVPTDQSTKTNEDSIVWEVPCGNKEHTQIVSIVTFASAVFSAVLIIFTSVSYSNSAFTSSDLKQS